MTSPLDLYRPPPTRRQRIANALVGAVLVALVAWLAVGVVALALSGQPALAFWIAVIAIVVYDGG